MEPVLLVERAEGVTRLTLNRPARLNALDRELRDAIADAFAAAVDDDATRVVVVTGAGERAFCAGQDLNESRAIGSADDDGWIGSWDRLFRAFLTCPKPIVAALNGVVAGGGFEMAMFADLRVASTTARLIMAEIDVALPTLTGQAWLSAHVFDSRMLEIVLTGRAVGAEEAARIGLVHRLAAPAELPAAAVALAADLAAKPEHALRANVARFRDVRTRETTRTGLLEAMRSYQTEAMASGEPQRVMESFLAARAARRAGTHSKARHST